MKSIIIAAPHSGSGKTTITLGLMECLRRRGLRVAPFKVGPDFIDPGYHRLVCGRPSINLDGWMCGPDFVRQSFARHSVDADIAIIEGVMGLFDGFGGKSDEGSTAQIARLTGSPVILVIDAKSMARSAAALVNGFAGFDPEVKVAGVIFNNVASENHGRILREAVESLPGQIRVLGLIPRDETLHIPSRHLGLLTVDEQPLPAEFLDHLVEVIRSSVDLGLVWAVATPQGAPLLNGKAEPRRKSQRSRPLIGVARDAAFCFVYEDNLRILRESGADIVEFSPLRDAVPPSGISGIYLPGGYPEVFADRLAANRSMLSAIHNMVEHGMPVYAECGGFIYLSRGVTGVDPYGPVSGEVSSGEGLREFVGIYPVCTRMLPRRKALGYREVELRAPSIIGPRGSEARGHEFHYSEMEDMPLEVERVYRVSKGQSDLGVEGYRHKNCLASYIHLHFGSCPEMAAAFVESCRKHKGK